MGCAVGACLGCVVMGDGGRPAAGLPRGPGLRRRRARLGGRLVKAKRRVVTSATARPGPAKRRPTVREAQARDRARLGGRRPPAPGRDRADRRHGARTPGRGSGREPVAPASRSTCRSTSAAASSARTRSSSRRGRSATASSTATSSTSSGSARSAARARRSSRAIGNPTPRVTETPGGMLNSIGLQNPGVDAVIEKYAADLGRLARAGHRQRGRASRSRDYVEVARRLEGVPGIAGIELNISLPERRQGRAPVRHRCRGRRRRSRRPSAARRTCRCS